MAQSSPVVPLGVGSVAAVWWRLDRQGRRYGAAVGDGDAMMGQEACRVRKLTRTDEYLRNCFSFFFSTDKTTFKYYYEKFR
jgi:hypothetical protein